MNTKIRKISPYALGIALCCYQVIQQPLVRAASLNADSTNLTTLTPSVPALETSAAAGGCPLQSLKDPKGTGSLGPQGKVNSVTGSTALSYQSNSPANSSLSTNSNAVAQLVPNENCCELGGTSDCELGGIPPAGGAAAGGGFPLAALLGLLPLAGIPFLVGGGNSDPNPTPSPSPVPESSSTASLVAGLGLFGLWYSRRFRSGQRTSS